MSFEAQRLRQVVSKEQCRGMGAKLPVLPGTGETDPETLGTSPASLAYVPNSCFGQHSGGLELRRERGVRGGAHVKVGKGTC